MIVQQTQNAFNDKAAQFVLVPLGGAVGFAVESWAGIMIALPFILFAPLAGWLSDRYSKRDVMLGAAFAQLLILGWLCGAVYLKNMPLALCGFFALAVQSAFFSPAKIGINKELVGSRHLGFAAGIQQMMAMLAILAGQIAAGVIYDKRYADAGGTPDVAWSAALGPLAVLAAMAAPAIFFAWIVPRTPSQTTEKLTPSVAVQHFKHLGALWADAGLRRAALGIAFFWGFASFINLWSVKLAKVLTGGQEGFGTLSSWFMAAASIGMAIGFGVASFLLRKRIELGWVPIAGLAMTVAAFVLFIIPPDGSLQLLEAAPLGVSAAVTAVLTPGIGGFLWGITALAFFAALFLAPLNAWIQDHYPAAKRGEMQSAVNLQDCFAGILAVAIIAGFELLADVLKISPLTGLRYQLIFVGLSCFVATALIIRLLPADFIRVLCIAVTRFVYQIRTSNKDRVPMKGGVLLLPNHVTYIDAFLISTACPRPVRFVMDDAFMEKRSIRIFTNIFETMTIRRDQPLEAIREVIRALKKGDAVCLFPEGQLTRTGTLCELQRGFELIAKKAGHPLIPMWSDGSWGSIFSFERNCFFRKVPHRLNQGMTFAFGEPIESRTANLGNVRDGIMLASSEAIQQRFQGRSWARRRPSAKHPAARAFRQIDEAARRRMWANGHQIGMVNALQQRHTFHVLKDEPIIHELAGLFVTFPDLFRAEIEFHDSFIAEPEATWVGGDLLRSQLLSTQINRRITLYDFGSQAHKPIERTGLCHCPCLAVDGTVVSMSMPHPPGSTSHFEPQLGHIPHSWGKLLPGWHLQAAADGTLRAHGPAAPDDGLPLPDGCTLDAAGFLTGAPQRV